MAKVSHTTTFEELGRNLGKALEVTVVLDVCAGQRATYWEPETGPSWDLDSVKVTGFSNDTDEVALSGGWLALAEAIAEKLVWERWDDIIEAACEADVC